MKKFQAIFRENEQNFHTCRKRFENEIYDVEVHHVVVLIAYFHQPMNKRNI